MPRRLNLSAALQSYTKWFSSPITLRNEDKRFSPSIIYRALLASNNRYEKCRERSEIVRVGLIDYRIVLLYSETTLFCLLYSDGIMKVQLCLKKLSAREE